MTRRFLRDWLLQSSMGFAFATLLCGALAPANADEAAMVSNIQAQRAGLTVQWFSQLTTTQPVVNSQVVVDENEAITYFEIKGGGLREVITDRDISPYGTPFGIEGAGEYAKIRQEIMQAQLKFDEIDAEVTIEQYSIPRVYVYAATNNGIIHCIDGESGETLWQTAVGHASYPTVGLGANQKNVAAVNGSRVFCMDAKTGKVTFEHQCLEAVLAPPAVSDEMVFVPLANGALQALPIKTKAFGNLPLNATGSATAPPIVAGNLIAWTTDEGVLVVGNKTGTGSLRYRLKAAGEFAASPTANAGSVFAVTLNGYIYAIDDRTGAIKWSFSVGERVTRAPVAIGKYLLIFTDENNMYKFEAETGAVAEGWERPISGITGYAGASDSRFYVEDIVGNLIVLDRESGRRLGSIDARSPMVPVINEKTDRIYVCTKSGLIQCLREIASVRPVFHDDLMEDDSAAKPAETEDASATEEETNPFKGDSKPTESDNPFGGGGKKSDDSNPFGGGNQQPANDNPFGNQKPSSDNPFGGGGSSDDNPFGKSGGDGLNPFNG